VKGEAGCNTADLESGIVYNLQSQPCIEYVMMQAAKFDIPQGSLPERIDSAGLRIAREIVEREDLVDVSQIVFTHRLSFVFLQVRQFCNRPSVIERTFPVR
jgi:hypothetical protein